jgi:diacylglycerol kinase family enzyme
VRLELDDDRTVRATTPLIFVGNNRYHLAAPHLGERTALDEGKLWLYQAPHANRGCLAWLALRTLVGLDASAELHEQDSEEFWIRAHRRAMRVATDGEVTKMTTPLHYRIAPKALAVIVPEAAPA